LYIDLPPDKEALDWNTRMKIAAGAAKGLEYLHDKASPPVFTGISSHQTFFLEKDFTRSYRTLALQNLVQLVTRHTFQHV